MTASKSRSWWGVFVSLLASIALAIAMIAVPAPKAEAQIVGGTARWNFDVANYSGPDIKFDFPGNTGDKSQSGSAYAWNIVHNGEELPVWAYCVEPSVGPGGTGWNGKVVNFNQYSGAKNKLMSNSPDRLERAQKVNWIVNNSFPHLSPAEMGLDGFTIPDIVPATAAAVWVIAADVEIERDSLTRKQLEVFDYLVANVKPLSLDTPYAGLFIESADQDVVVVPPRQAPVPKISTSASFFETSDVKTSTGRAPSSYVWDDVKIDNIYPGYLYTLKAELHRKKEDGSLKRESTKTTRFTPGEEGSDFVITKENGDGTVSGTIKVRLSGARDIEDGEVGVVYERLTARDITRDGLPIKGDNHQIAEHVDPNDAGQTVRPYFSGGEVTVPTVSSTTSTSPTSQTSVASPASSTATITETSTVTETASTTVYQPTTTTQTQTTVKTVVETTTSTPQPSTVTEKPDTETTTVTEKPDTETTTVTEKPDTETTTTVSTTTETPAPATKTETATTTVTETPGVKTETVTSTTSTTSTVTSTAPVETVTTTVKEGLKPNPAIKTRAEFKDNATQVIAGATVVDTVSYYGLVAGKNYTLNAKLVDKQDANRVLGTGAVTFQAEGTKGELVNGSVKVEIAVNKDVTEPVQAAVAFERLTSTEVNAQGEESNGKTNDIAKHEDINDENQTVRTVFEPSIKTNAKFDKGSAEVVAGSTVIDTVEYKGLVPGKEYTLSAKLMERLGEAGSYSAGRVLGEGTETFTAKTTDGSVDVTITVNDDVTTPVAAAVAFEELTSTQVTKDGRNNDGGKTVVIAEHKDINDGNQTVEGPVTTPTPTTSEEPAPTTTIQLLPSTEATTTGGASATKTAGVSEETSTTSEETTTDATTTEATTSVAEPSTSETAPSSTPVVPLVPSNPEGKIDTKVTVNGKTIVDGKPVTVTEQDVINGLKVTDEITYSGLVAGAKYRFEGQLQHVEFDEAGEVTKVTPVTEVKFTDVVAAENGAGSATVDFGTLTELTAGATYVVYEKAIPLDENNEPTTNPDGTPKDPSKDNRKVVEHKDPKDKAQTFVVEKTPTTSPTAPVAPSTTPDNCVPVTTVSTVPGTTVAESTVPGTTVPGTTNPGTPETPGTTVPGTTNPGTTVPGTTVEESTVPVTTLPEHCVTTSPGTTTPVTPTTEPTVPTVPTAPTQPTVPTQPTAPVVPPTPTTTTTPVVPPVVWFPNPQIGTNADFKDGAKEVKSGNTIVDTVKYQGLVPGKTYTLTAELVSKDAYNGLADKNAYGEAVIGTGTATFTASETGVGTVTVDIPVIDGITEPVRAAVAFETLTSTEVDRNGKENFAGGDTPGDVSDDNLITEHKNINDLNQTVRSPLVPGTPQVFEPYISTTANFAEGSAQTVAGEKVIDTVKYSGLVPGKTYTLTADLVAKDSQAVIGQGRTQFKADAAGFGSVDVEITVADWVKNPVYAAVAFETLTSTEVDAKGTPQEPGNRVPVTIADHRNIEDASQTVITPDLDEGIPSVKTPGVSTNADFSKGAEVTNGAVIRDVVKYWGLVPGKEYTATADLMERLGADAPYKAGRKLGTGTATFIPTQPAGMVTVEIPVTGLNDGEKVAAAVAFETITSTEVDRFGNETPNEGGNKIAEHKDINDSYQTVVTDGGQTPPTTTTTPPGTQPTPGDNQSSESNLWWLLLIPGLGLIPALIGGGGGSSQPTPKPAPTPVPSKPAPAPATSTAPKPQGNPVAPDSPRSVIQQVPSGGTVRDAQMPTFI